MLEIWDTTKNVITAKVMPKKEEAPAAPAGPSDNDLLKEILAALKAK